MASLLKKYRERMRHEHGWEVKLECPKCRRTVMPLYKGWKPISDIKFGSAPSIYAILECPDCNSDLKNSAGKKLVELFSPLSIPGSNKKVILYFLLIGFVWLAAIYIGLKLFGWIAYLLFLFLGPIIMYFNYRIASLRHRCSCGKAAYKFMGMLGRSYCYRCSNCGNLLRLRD